MEAFATVDSLAAGWRDLSESEQDIAEVLLGRASAYLAGLLRRDGIAVDISDRIQVINLETVTCNMVRRVMDAPDSGASSITQGIGSTNATLAFSNPDASLYLTKSDMIVLGLAKKSTFWSIPVRTNADGCFYG